MRNKEKCVRSKVKLNTFFLETLTLRNWGYSRCLKKHSEKKVRQKQTKQQNDIIKDEIDLTKAIKIVYNIKRPNS